MKRVVLNLVLSACMAFAFVSIGATDANAEVRCFYCGSGSKGSCPKGVYCYGERSDCVKKGCRVASSSSKCSTAANVKKCSTGKYFRPAPPAVCKPKGKW
jgi:hypothetical protein